MQTPLHSSSYRFWRILTPPALLTLPARLTLSALLTLPAISMLPAIPMLPAQHKTLPAKIFFVHATSYIVPASLLLKIKILHFCFSLVPVGSWCDSLVVVHDFLVVLSNKLLTPQNQPNLDLA